MRSTSLLLPVVLLALLAACGDDKAPQENGGDLTSQIEVQSPTFNIINIMKASGLQVRVPARTDRAPMDADGYLLDVNNGVALEVYEYDSAEELNEVKGKISPDGTKVGNETIGWDSPVHLYSTEKVIVVYRGSDSDTRQSLATMFGPEFAGNR